MDTPVLTPPTPFQIRQELEAMILHELLGPAGGSDEEVNERHIYERYLVGMLAPLNNSYEAPGGDDELAVGDGSEEEGVVEAPNPFSKTIFPSTLGLTFCVDGEESAIQVTARWGKYEKAYSETLTTDKGNPKRVWKREQIEERKKIALREGDLKAWEVKPAVVITGIARRQDDQWIVSLFLVNGQQEPETNKDSAWLFQPELIVESTDPSRPAIFCRRSSKRKPGKSDPNYFAEEMAMEMLYRKRTEFAVGHNVSVHATPDPENYEQAVRIETKVVPAWEVAKVTPPGKDEIPALAGLSLSMKELGETPDGELAAKLNPLAEAYEQWIKEQEQKIPGLAGEYKSVAQQAVANCKTTLNRIKEGIALISANPEAAESFRFANRAMYLQRAQSLKAMKRRGGQDATLGPSEDNPTWYPFQLAFLLLNLPGLTDPNHPDRTGETNAVSDLLWFPTGGGKTEAYLGLTAYTLGIRRLQRGRYERDGEHGVAVLMRYTLRLLTLQQFQRASALICACEAIRRDDPEKWGDNPFRLGLWVGGGATPNKTEHSREAIEKIRSNQAYQIINGTPHQLTNCPWCGYAIDPKSNIIVEGFPAGSARTIIYCGDPMGDCPFTNTQSEGEGLPVMVVDEEIYRRLPSLLIATVDKFAQMPWNGATQMLFGQVNGYCNRHGFVSPEIEDKTSHNASGNYPRAKTTPRTALRPPDLIIQDELHLISGPLGSLVGLYETAVDSLCSWQVNGRTVRPKVVASTATIRQARDQIYNLFLRDVQIFPPQCIDIEDNFFSRQRETSEQYPGRRYLGICAPGKRLKAALIRVYVAQLSAAQALYEKYGSVVDPWMTLVGYFNSIRELGGMRRMIDDDVAARLQKMDRRGLAVRRNLIPKELTSRVGSTDIPFILDQLEKTFDPAKDPKEIPAKERPIDVLLATNMISVGVDVSRLGAMIAAGQPKSTAEYIQATSRVGRSKPGLVITVYNWARPRDLSHYEGFENFHARFYQHVEALSLTPFSSGAVDRGLAALLVSLVRLRGVEFNANERAAAMQSSHPVVQEAIKSIAARAANVAGNQTGEFVEQSLKSKLDVWLKRAKPIPGGDTLGYKTDTKKQNIGLLQDPYLATSGDFVCLQSLRNVEPLANLILRPGFLDAQTDRLPEPWEQPAAAPVDEYAEEDGE
ncbi:MAG: DISARM system helicase DrmA [Blastocatellales bacterium]